MRSTPSAATAIDRLTSWVLAHKRLVVGFWVVLTVAGMFAAGRVPDALQTEFGMPDSQSFSTNQEIRERFGGGGAQPPLVAVAELPAGADARSRSVGGELRALERDLTEALPGARVASFGSTGDGAYLSDDGRTAFVLVHPRVGPGGGFEGVDPKALAAANRVAGKARVGGGGVALTGEQLLLEGAEGGGDRPARDGRAAGALSALHRVRRAADPARLGGGRADAAAGGARDRRAARRPPAAAQHRAGRAPLGRLRSPRPAPPLDRCAQRLGRARRSRRRRDRDGAGLARGQRARRLG